MNLKQHEDKALKHENFQLKKNSIFRNGACLMIVHTMRYILVHGA